MTQLEKKKITKKLGWLASEEANYVDDKALDRQIDSLHSGLERGVPIDVICGSASEVIRLGLLTSNQRSEKSREKLFRLAGVCYKSH